MRRGETSLLSFVHCTEDVGIFSDLQKGMAKYAVENGAAVLKVRELESSHGPFWSMPAAVVGFLEDVCKSCFEG